MEVAVELEDDLFFADLSKRISLLIMDDDDDDDYEDPISRCPSVSFPAFSGANYPITQSPYLQEHICRQESKGTGVFIPKASHPRRKHRQGSGRYSSFNRKSNRQQQLHDNTTKMASQACYYNNSFYTRKD